MVIVNDRIDSLEQLLEVYFGDVGLQRIERKLGQFRSKYFDNRIFNTLNYGVNTDPDLLEINRLLEKEFGFGCCSLNILMAPVGNACTFVPTGRFDIPYYDLKNHIKATRTGFKYDKDLDLAVIIYISSYVIFNPEYTDREVLAIILHEIGHNFQCSLNGASGLFSNIIVILMAIHHPIVALLLTNKSIDAYSKAINKAKDDKNLLVALDFCANMMLSIPMTVGKTMRDLLVISKPITELLVSIPFRVIRRLMNIYGLIELPFTYRDEKIADNFATMYGYGPDLVTGLEKIQRDTGPIMGTIYKIPGIGLFYSSLELFSKEIMSFFDPHPVNYTRYRDQVKLLKKEIEKDDIDPKMKARVIKDINRIESEIAEFSKIRNSVADPLLFTKAYYKVMYDLSEKVPSLKDLLMDIDPDKRFAEYDDIYKAAVRR